MNTPRLLGASMGCSAALAVLIGVGTGSLALGVVAVLAALAMTAGVVFGLPPLVLIGALAAMGSSAAAARSGASAPLMVAMALLLWLAVETAWRALDRAPLTGTVDGQSVATVDRVWFTVVGMVLLGTLAFGLVVAAMDGRVSERGLGPWMLATGLVMAMAAVVGVGVVRSRSLGRVVPARGSGSSGPRPRTALRRRG